MIADLFVCFVELQIEASIDPAVWVGAISAGDEDDPCDTRQ